MDQNYWQRRLAHSTLTRRRLISGVAVAGMGGASLALAGCGGTINNNGSKSTQASAVPTAASTGAAASSSTAATSTTNAATSAARAASPATTAVQTAAIIRGGTLTYAEATNPNSLDLHQDPAVRPFLAVIYNKILKQVAGGVVPDLASRMPEQPDATTMLLNIRSGVRFHDIAPVNGRELTAVDIKYSLERVGTNDPKFQSRRFVENIDKIEAVDKNNLKLTLKIPFAPQTTYLAYPTMVIVPQEAVAVNGDLRTGPLIGTGGFMSKDIRPGVEWVNVRNPNYWETGLPYADQIKATLIADRGSTQAQFRAKALDFLSLARDEFDQVKTSIPGLGFEKSAAGRSRVILNTQSPMFKDPRVRQAIHLATDRQELINLVGGGEGQLYSTLMHFFPGVLTEDELKKMPGFGGNKAKDLADAKALLTAAGFPNGLTIPNYLAVKLGGNPSVEDNTAAHAQQLARAGIRATIQPIEYADWTPRILAHQFDITGVNNGVRQDPDDILYTEMHSKGPRNDCNYNDPALDALIEKQRSLTDEKARAAVWHDIELKSLELLGYIPLYMYVDFLSFQQGLQGLTNDGGRINYYGHLLPGVGYAKKA